MVVERTREERRTEVEEAKTTHWHLATAGTDPATVVDRAVAAVDDLDAAAAFVEDVGVDGLARAVEAADEGSGPCWRSDGTVRLRSTTLPPATFTAVAEPI